MKYTIEDLRNGKCAVRNDGTLEELRKVLSLAFPINGSSIEGLNKYYSASSYRGIYAEGSEHYNHLPSQSVKDFLNIEEELKCGDEVEISIGGEWRSGFIYIANHPKSRLKELHIVMADKTGTFKVVYDVRKPHSKTELTREQIAEKFGIDVDKLIIKD